MSRTGLIVQVPEAEPVVGEWRKRHDWSAAHGVPAHVTTVFPFVPEEKLDDRVLADLRELLAGVPAFRFVLTRVARFPDVAWLAPDPSERFRELTELVVARWPEYPPYEGEFEEVIPHLTVAEGDEALQDEVDRALSPSLPFEAEAIEVTLIVEDDTGWWHPRERFPLRGSGSKQAG